jgi:hypothetical protein
MALSGWRLEERFDLGWRQVIKGFEFHLTKNDGEA